MEHHSDTPARVRLSICMATFKRGPFIGETLDSILPQLVPGVELIVVDGASPDNTQEVLEAYQRRHPHIRYYREPENSGVDRDYDKAVGYATGDYCWLMTDDDLLNPGAIETVLDALREDPAVVVVNAELKTVDMSTYLAPGMMALEGEERFQPGERDRFFTEAGRYLSFIGSVVIDRRLWLQRDRATYYGSLFIHAGVIFQAPLERMARLIRRPLIAIRYGNAMWTSRGFEIWMFKWPGLIWSFPGFSPETKSQVYAPEPWRAKKKVLLYRALGGYSKEEFHRFIEPRTQGVDRLIYAAIAQAPARLMNVLASFYCAFINVKARSDLYDLSRSRHASGLSRMFARWHKL